MSGLPSGVSVLRHVPQHLVDGFMRGDYRLWGGVLRRTVGQGRGQIVGFLTEGWDLMRTVDQGLPVTADALRGAVGSAQMAAQLAALTGVLSLGVQIGGFVMLQRRLNNLTRQIDVVHAELRQVREDVRWLAKTQIAAIRADAESAISTAERAARQGDRQLFNQAKTAGDRARRFLVTLCEDMLVNGRAVPQRQLFETFMQLGVEVAHTEARCDEAVEGAGQAARDLTTTAATFRRLSDGFHEQTSNFQRNPLALLRVGEAGRADVKALSRRLAQMVDRLESYVPQLELQHIIGLDSQGWQAMVTPKDSGTLTCLTTDGEPTGDLLELVLAQTRS